MTATAGLMLVGWRSSVAGAKLLSPGAIPLALPSNCSEWPLLWSFACDGHTYVEGVRPS